MAKRPIFTTSDTKPYFFEKNIEFIYYSGFSTVQKQKSIKSLHEAFLKNNSQNKILEISSNSTNNLGIQLSAFNLIIKTKTDKQYSVEVAFQSSKVFEKGGPYKDLLTKTSKEAKKDPRLKSSGKLKSFYFGKRIFGLFPTTYFYNWLYINALNLYPNLSEELMNYNAFTDIAFNPNKSINCQARAAAVYVSLRKAGLLEEALKNKEAFLEVVYGKNDFEKLNDFNDSVQLSMLDKL